MTQAEIAEWTPLLDGLHDAADDRAMPIAKAIDIDSMADSRNGR